MSCIAVDYIFTATRELYTVYTFCFAYQMTLSVFHVHGISVALQWRDFGAQDDDLLRLLVEAYDAFHYPFTLGELFVRNAHFLVHVEEVQMVVTVTLALVDEFLVVPRQEDDGVLRFHVLGVTFFVQHGFLFAGCCVIANQLGMVLVTVQLDDIHTLFVRTPAYVGKVSVGGVACLQIDGLLGGRIENTDGHLVAGHTCHRVLVRFQGSDAGRCIYLRIVCHHALVHAVESHQVALRAPEDTAVDAEFIAMHGLSAEYAVRFVGHSKSVHVEVVSYGVCYVSAGGVQRHVGIRFLGEVVAESQCSGFPVIHGIALSPSQLHFGLFRPRIAQPEE